MLGLKVKQKVYIIQYGNCIPVFVHVESHLGRDKTIQKISSRFFWKNINEDIRIFVQHCDNVRELTLSFQSPMLSCILLFQCQMFDTRLVTSCVGMI